MPSVWTHGTWTVSEGREHEFVDAWRKMAREAAEVLPVVEPPTLLRDRDRPNVFVSFGPWPSIDDVHRFRESTVFRESVQRIEQMLESFEPRTLDEVVRRG